MRTILVEQMVEQVHDGTHYEGHVKIGSTILGYNLVFGVSIPQLEGIEPTEDKSKIRHLFQITVNRDDTIIELTDEEYDLFFAILVENVLDFFENRLSRVMNEVEMAHGGDGTLATFGVKMGAVSKAECDFTPEICEMLSAEKFGCVFAD